MRTPFLVAAVCLALTWGTAPAQEAPPLPAVGPPFAEVEALWNAFWTRVVDGDMGGASQYVHSSRRYPFSSEKTRSELQELARQMAFCRLDPKQLAMSRDEVAYPVWCKYGNETAQTLVIIRRDFDGLWRFHTF